MELQFQNLQIRPRSSPNSSANSAEAAIVNDLASIQLQVEQPSINEIQSRLRRACGREKGDEMFSNINMEAFIHAWAFFPNDPHTRMNYQLRVRRKLMLAALNRRELEHNAKIASEMVIIFKDDPAKVNFLQKLAYECITKANAGMVEEVQTFGRSLRERFGLRRNDDGLMIAWDTRDDFEEELNTSYRRWYADEALREECVVVGQELGIEVSREPPTVFRGPGRDIDCCILCGQ